MVHVKRAHQQIKAKLKQNKQELPEFYQEKESCGGICGERIVEEVNFERIKDGIRWILHTKKQYFLKK